MTETISSFAVENVAATETRNILSFSVDMGAKTCTVKSESVLEWLSGENPCKSTSPLEATISGEDFDEVFSPIMETIFNKTKG